jgi:hypothetical protein
VLIRALSPGVFNVDEKYFTDAKLKKERGALPELRKLLGCKHDADGNDAYDVFPPILCKDGDVVKAENRFLSPHLFTVRSIYNI